MADALSDEEIDDLLEIVDDDVDKNGNPIKDPLEVYYKNMDNLPFYKTDSLAEKRDYQSQEFKLHEVLLKYNSEINKIYHEDKSLSPSVYIDFMSNQLYLLGRVIRYFWKNKEFVEEHENIKLPEEKELKELYFLINKVNNKLNKI